MDHSKMNHGMKGGSVGTKMPDMSTMDHSGMGGMKMNGSHSMMKMWFHTDINDYLLFKPWLIQTAGEMVAAFFGVFILAALYEGLKIGREHMLTTQAKAASQQASEQNYEATATGDLPNGEADNIRFRRNVVKRYQILSSAHLLQTMLHMLQVLISYFLMLIFMTYNVWLCLAVILGAGMGYFLFSWKRTVLLEDLTEHCH